MSARVYEFVNLSSLMISARRRHPFLGKKETMAMTNIPSQKTPYIYIHIYMVL